MAGEIAVPPQAQYIIETLNSHGFQAYVVGGCVRDSLLGKNPQDWDITTSAPPQTVKAIFGRTIDTGIAHGTVTVMRGRESYEVTTYRIDGEYEDKRHPKNVVFTSDLAEDLRRRDFTINAMAYSHRDGLIDEFQGISDLREKKIRCVGNAMDRFTEDALRILRAIRFSAQLGFDIEPETRAAIKALAPNLVHVSKERIQTELTKILLSAHPNHVRELFEDGIAPYISENFAGIHWEDHFIDPKIPALRHLRWAALLRRETKERAETILKELKMDNSTIASVKLLVQWWRKPIDVTEMSVRKVMSRMSPQAYDDLLVMKKYTAEVPESPKELERIEELTQMIRGRGDCVSLKALAVTGRDLISMGMKPGETIGETLEYLLQLVLEYPEWNTKERLIQEAEKALKKST